LVVVGCLLLIRQTQQKGMDGGVAIAVQPDLSEGSAVGKIIITLSNRSPKAFAF
jgi:hypothetical protein